MDELAIAKFVVGRNRDLDTVTTYLNTMPGAVGVLAFDRLGETVQTERAGRETAEREAASLRGSVDIAVRKYLSLDDGAQVTAAQRQEFTDALSAAGDGAPVVIVPKHAAPAPDPDPDAESAEPRPSDPMVAIADAAWRMMLNDERIQKLMLSSVGIDLSGQDEADLNAGSQFVQAFRLAYREFAEDDDTGPLLTAAAAEWAEMAADLLKDVKAKHAADSSASETDPLKWAAGKLDG